MWVVLIYADTTVWNALCDQSSDSGRLTKDLAVQGAQVVLGTNAVLRNGQNVQREPVNPQQPGCLVCDGPQAPMTNSAKTPLMWVAHLPRQIRHSRATSSQAIGQTTRRSRQPACVSKGAASRASDSQEKRGYLARYSPHQNRWFGTTRLTVLSRATTPFQIPIPGLSLYSFFPR